MGARLDARPTGRRTRVLLAMGVAAITLAAVLGVFAWRDTKGSGSPPAAKSRSLPSRTVAAGAVTVKIDARQLDAAGAVFKVSFDTHSVDLDQDMTRQARLTVGTTPWPVIGWSGDGPGGHHREGELRFGGGGPAAGTATLSIEGLPQPATVTWDLGG